MHLKLDSSGSIDDGDVARDLGQAPADIVVLSAADSDLAAFGAAHAADLMARDEKCVVSRKTFWRWLKAENLVVKSRKVRNRRTSRRHAINIASRSRKAVSKTGGFSNVMAQPR